MDHPSVVYTVVDLLSFYANDFTVYKGLRGDELTSAYFFLL